MSSRSNWVFRIERNGERVFGSNAITWDDICQHVGDIAEEAGVSLTWDELEPRVRAGEELPNELGGYYFEIWDARYKERVSPLVALADYEYYVK